MTDQLQRYQQGNFDGQTGRLTQNALTLSFAIQCSTFDYPSNCLDTALVSSELANRKHGIKSAPITLCSKQTECYTISLTIDVPFVCGDQKRSQAHKLQEENK